ncbi:MAG: YhcH/YjgK/YiaL family protein [Sphingobacteriales bacterium]|nr:YhcH/YjgK/YiaL family protein [Sphingobacteriales bacterium]
MIVDHIANAAKYFSLHPLFEKAFAFINSTDFNEMPDGKTQVDEGLLAILSNGNGKTKEDSLKKFECHNRNIDIQLCLSGNETIGWKPRNFCTNPNGDFNEEKDVQFYNDNPDMFFQLTDGQFAIFFPEDVHAPMIGDAMIKKLVMKVKI